MSALLSLFIALAWGRDIDGLKEPALLPAPGEGREMVGQPAPDWGRLQWVDFKGRLRPKDLRGRVVLLRWWTDGCLYCVDSAPVLNELYQKYAPAGLVVVGMYHPKPPRKVDPANVREAAELLSFRFPIALDNKWKALKRYWLKGHERAFTSVSFLIDPQGIIRWVHPGGTYSQAEAVELERKIIQLMSPDAGKVPVSRAARP